MTIRAIEKLYSDAHEYVKTKGIKELIEMCRFHTSHITSVTLVEENKSYLSSVMFWCAYDELCDRFNNDSKIVNKMIWGRA